MFEDFKLKEPSNRTISHIWFYSEDIVLVSATEEGKIGHFFNGLYFFRVVLGLQQN